MIEIYKCFTNRKEPFRNIIRKLTYQMVGKLKIVVARNWKSCVYPRRVRFPAQRAHQLAHNFTMTHLKLTLSSISESKTVVSYDDNIIS